MNGSDKLAETRQNKGLFGVSETGGGKVPCYGKKSKKQP